MDNSWRERAACRGIDTGLFFIERSDPDASTKLAEAKSICGRCPVREECAKAGRNESSGVWGGLTVEERMGTPGPQDPDGRMIAFGDPPPK